MNLVPAPWWQRKKCEPVHSVAVDFLGQGKDGSWWQEVPLLLAWVRRHCTQMYLQMLFGKSAQQVEQKVL